jgi:protein involved in polysaccharide export with SLBB domain
MAFLAACAFAAPGNATYLLATQDKVRIAIHEWRPSKDEFFEWKAINAEYTVQPNGNLSMPLIGEVRAAGVSTADLALNIKELLSERTGIAQLPNVAIEIVQFRPVYVTGHVERPGEFSYRPNLLVLQAVALSGGLRRPPLDARIERDVINGRLQLQQQAAEYHDLLARQARFQTEFANDEAVNFPPELRERKDDPQTAMLLEQERELFQARRSASQSQIQMLNELRAFLETEVASLEHQLGAHNRQMELVRKELDSVNGLVAKGLAVEPRRLGLERIVAQLDGDRLRLESSATRVRQEISRTGIAILELSAKREIEAATGLRETQGKLEEVMRRFETSKELLGEAEALASTSGENMGRGRLQPIYTIIRQNGDGIASEITASETTLVNPGDTIKVDMPVDDRTLNHLISASSKRKNPS